jgi:hypothetical protein
MPWIRQHGGIYINVPDDESPKWRCSVIVKHEAGENTICGTPFFEGQYGQFVRHVTACAKKHEDVIEKAAPRNSRPDWLTGAPVLEEEFWLDEADASGETNRQKVIRGAKKL